MAEPIPPCGNIGPWIQVPPEMFDAVSDARFLRPRSLAWYDALIDRWAEKEKQAIRQKLSDYGLCKSDDCFGVLASASIRLDSTEKALDAWAGRHFDAFGPGRTLTLEQRYARYKDVLGWAFQGIAYCEWRMGDYSRCQQRKQQ